MYIRRQIRSHGKKEATHANPKSRTSSTNVHWHGPSPHSNDTGVVIYAGTFLNFSIMSQISSNSTSHRCRVL